MSVTELHPEELFDRQARGTLTRVERARLDAHLAQCSVCRLECAARADFLEELSADVDVPGIAERVLAPHAPRRRRVRVVALLAAAALTITTAAIAARATLFATHHTHEPFASVPVTVRKTLDARASPRAIFVTVKPHESAASETPEIASVHERVETLQVPETTGAQAFALANEARNAGDHHRAASLYLDVIHGHASAPEATPARLALARMLLDDGDAQGALASFDAYLQDSGAPLREEALLGRARSLESLHRDDEERAAWSALLGAYPQTVHAARANRRLEELAPH